MRYALEIEMEGLPKSMAALYLGDWRMRSSESKKWHGRMRRMVKKGFLKIPPEPIKNPTIFYTRHSAVKPDLDNLQSSFKFIQDALKEVGLIEDDSQDHIQTVHLWECARPLHGKVSIRLEWEG